MQPVERLVARRLGRLHQLLLQIVDVLFEPRCADARDIPAALRALDESALDLTAPADVLPPRSKQVFACELFRQLEYELEAVPALQASGALAEELDKVDTALRGG